jgi:hypothetical protein
VGGDVPIDSKTLLVTDFMNLKIKPTQSFRCAHISKMCVRVFIGVSAHTCMSIYVCIVFLKKKKTCASQIDVFSFVMKLTEKYIKNDLLDLFSSRELAFVPNSLCSQRPGRPGSWWQQGLGTRSPHWVSCPPSLPVLSQGSPSSRSPSSLGLAPAVGGRKTPVLTVNIFLFHMIYR